MVAAPSHRQRIAPGAFGPRPGPVGSHPKLPGLAANFASAVAFAAVAAFWT